MNRKKTRQEEYRQRVIADGGAQESYLFDAQTVGDTCLVCAGFEDARRQVFVFIRRTV